MNQNMKRISRVSLLESQHAEILEQDYSLQIYQKADLEAR